MTQEPRAQGDVVERFRLVRRCGRGGMGEIWLAHDSRLDREVALKFLPAWASTGEGAREQLFREARAAARLSHPNVVVVYDIYEARDQVFVAMEFIRGLSLAQIIDRHGPRPWREVCRMILQAARGLGAAHEAGIVHRDIKPSNIMLADRRLVKVVDFGLALARRDTRDLVRRGALVGTPHFMSPEQCKGLPVDPRSDLYSLGCTLWCLLTGKPPYPAIAVGEVLEAHIKEPFPDIRSHRSDLPPALLEALEQATRKDPAERQQSIAEFASAIERCSHRGSPRRGSTDDPQGNDAAAGRARAGGGSVPPRGFSRDPGTGSESPQPPSHPPQGEGEPPDWPSFQITISPLSAGKYHVLVQGPEDFGSPVGTLALDPGASEVRGLLEALEQQRASVPELEEFGSRLFDRLLPPSLRAAFLVSREHGRRAGAAEGGLRVLLDVHAEELRELPWESLFHGLQRHRLATDPRSPLARYVHSRGRRREPIRPPLRLLIATAAPRGLASPQATLELDAISGALGEGAGGVMLEPLELRSCTKESLRRALEEVRPHVVQFVGHGARRGAQSGLFLEGANRSAEFVSTDLLRELFAMPGTVHLAVISACSSLALAQGLAEEGIAAIGTSFPIRNEAATLFSRRLYELVALGEPLDRAVNRARLELRLADSTRVDWCAPALFLPRGEARLVEASGSATRRVPVREESPRPATTPRRPAELNRTTLSPSASGEVVVMTGRGGVEIESVDARGRATVLGTTGNNGQLGPLSIASGSWRLRATFPGRGLWPPLARGRPVTRRIEVRPEMTTVAEFSAPGDHRMRWSAAAGLSVLAAGILFFSLFPPGSGTDRSSTSLAPSADGEAQPRSTAAVAVAAPAPPPPNPLPSQTVLIPSGDTTLGAVDDTHTIRLLQAFQSAHEPSIGQRAARVQFDSFFDSLFTQHFDVPARAVAVKTFLLDTREVTNAEYREFLRAIASGTAAREHPASTKKAGEHRPDPDESTYQDRPSATDALPVTGIDWFDAWAYAAWRGKRLPTHDEWEWAARDGARALAYPWGEEFDVTRFRPGGEESALPAPVASFEPAAPSRPAAMAGNVREWTVTEAPESEKAGEPLMVVPGGAWKDDRPDFMALTFPYYRVSRESRSAVIGFRCARDADGSTPWNMTSIPGGSGCLGGESSPLIAVLRKFEPRSFIADLLGPPPRVVSLPAFRIDRHEVSNRQYDAFLEYVKRHGDAPFRHADQPAGKDHTPAYRDQPKLLDQNQPVVGVDFFDAYAYARWAGKRLPSDEEWQRAARGPTTRLYPWGDRFSPDRCVSGESPLDRPSAVSAPTDDSSYYGVLHMGGNVSEWTDTSPAGSEKKVVRGGSWLYPCERDALVFPRVNVFSRGFRNPALGFRCASDPEAIPRDPTAGEGEGESEPAGGHVRAGTR